MKRRTAIGTGILLAAWLGLTASAQMGMPGGGPPGGGCPPDERGSALLCPGEGRMLEWMLRDHRVLEELGLETEKKQGITKRLFECQRKRIELNATIQKAFVTQAELLSDVTTNESDLIKNVEALAEANLKLAKLELGELTALRKAVSREQYAHIQFVYRQRGGAPMAGPGGGAMGPGAMPGMSPMGGAMPAPMPGPMPGLLPPNPGVGPGAAPGLVIPPPPPPSLPPAAAAAGVLPPLPADPSKKESPAKTR